MSNHDTKVCKNYIFLFKKNIARQYEEIIVIIIAIFSTDSNPSTFLNSLISLNLHHNFEVNTIVASIFQMRKWNMEMFSSLFRSLQLVSDITGNSNSNSEPVAHTLYHLMPVRMGEEWQIITYESSFYLYSICSNIIWLTLISTISIAVKGALQILSELTPARRLWGRYYYPFTFQMKTLRLREQRLTQGQLPLALRIKSKNP